MKPKETNLDEILIQYAPELTDTEHIKLRAVLERHVQAAMQEVAMKIAPVNCPQKLSEPGQTYFSMGWEAAFGVLVKETELAINGTLQPKPTKEVE